jgi:hypothetical protein
MTRRISLIGIVGAALVLVAPAFGSLDERGIEPQSQAPSAQSLALNEKYGLGDAAVQGSGRSLVFDDHLKDSATWRPSTALEARSRAMNAKYGLGDASAAQGTGRVFDDHVRDGAYSPANVALTARSQALNAKYGLGDSVVRTFDDHKNAPASVSSTGTVSGSGSEIEWPRIGIGVGIGLLLGLCLLIGVRHLRIRPVAH